MKESRINYFFYKDIPGPVEITVFSILNSFRTTKFKDQIELARSFYRTGNFEMYNLLKGNLMAVTFSGTFSPRRTLVNLVNYSGYIILDIDKAGDSLIFHKKCLEDNEFVHAVWLSPSGDGLKFLIKTSNDQVYHKLVYFSAVKYFQEKYGLKVDTSGSDIPRLCYVSYDPDIYINFDASYYDEILEDEAKPIKNKTIGEKLKREFDLNVHLDKRNLKNNNFDKERLKSIYNYLNKRNLSITSSYNDWIRVAFAISNSFNFDFGYIWFIKLAQLDGEFYDEYESIKLILRCYNTGMSQSTFGTIQYLANQKGWELR